MAEYRIEEITSELSTGDFLPMVAPINEMPPGHELHGASLPEIQDHLNRLALDETAALFVAKQRQFDAPVALAGVYIDNSDIPTAVISEVAVAPRAQGNRLGKLLLSGCIDWANRHQANRIVLAVAPIPESRGAQLLHSFDFVDGADGLPEIQTAN